MTIARFRSAGPDELELDSQLDVVRQRGTAAWQVCVPADAIGRAIDRGLEGEAEPRVAREVLGRALNGAGGMDRLGYALDGQVAVDLDLVTVDFDLLRGEGDLGVVVNVEELRTHQVRGEVFVLDVDRVNRGGAAEPAVDKRGGDVLERTAERRDHVRNRERDRRVDGGEFPGACQAVLGRNDGHGDLLRG